MISILKYGEVSNEEIFARGTAVTDVSAIVSDIIENVRANGHDFETMYKQYTEQYSL